MRSRTLFVALALCAIVSAAFAFQVNPGTDSPVEFAEPRVANPDQLRVAILSDRTTGWPEGLGVLQTAVAEIGEESPDFVVTVGDMINGHTRHEDDWLHQFNDEWAALIDPLGAPLFPAAGNHDTRPGTHNPGDDMNERLYEQHFGPLHYSFDVEQSHFVMLYSDDGLGEEGHAHLGDAQVEWLRADLQQTEADNIFVFLHRPLWTGSHEDWDEVHEMLVATGRTRAVIAGHNHSYEKYPERDGIAYYVLGTTGGTTHRELHAGGFDHWCLLTVEGPSWQLQTKLVSGEWVADDFILHEDMEVRDQIASLRNWESGPQMPLPTPQPRGISSAPLTVRLTNPLDVTVPVRVELEPDRGDGWSMAPAYSDRTLTPHSSQEFSIDLAYEENPDPPAVEPQLNLIYTLTDSRERDYHVTLRRRLAWSVQMRVLEQNIASHEVDGRRTEPEGWEGAYRFGLPTWSWAPWETREPAGQVWLSWEGEDRLFLFLSTSDDRLEDFPDNQSDTILSDALVLRALDASGERRAVAIFPHREGPRRALRVVEGSPETEWPAIEGVELVARGDNRANDPRLGPMYRDVRLWELSLPAEEWVGPGWREREPIFLNVEVIDNDGTLWSSVRSWMPRWSPRDWAQISFGPRRD